MKWIKRGAIALAVVVGALVLSAGAYTVYVINSVDPNVMPANHGKVETKLFMGAPSQTPKPLLVAFGGSEGRNLWASKRWEAERQKFLDEGYAFLAVAYFGLPGLPEQLDRIALEGIHAAITETAKRPDVNGQCVALLGGSKGAELALLLASRYSDIDAVAAVVPGNAVFVALTDALTTSSFSHNGQALPFVPFPWSATLPLLTGDKRKVFDIMASDRAAMERAAIPVEKIKGPVYFLSGTRDEMWDSSGMSEAMMARLRDKKFAFHSEHLAIEGNHTDPFKHLDRVRGFLSAHFKPRVADNCAPKT